MNPGTIGWQDLAVPDAEKVRNFYEKVVGWRAEPVEMGGYSDFSMIPPGGKDAVAGICHARGPSADLPPQWLIYITVDDMDLAAADCTANGGSIIKGPIAMGSGRICVIRDPAGAARALYHS